MCSLNYFKLSLIISYLILVNDVYQTTAQVNLESEDNLVKKYFQNCFKQKLKLTCVVEKATIALETSIDMDIPIVPGLVYVRNNSTLDGLVGRDLTTGVDRLVSSLIKFMESHSVNLEFSDEGRRRRRKRFGFLLPALLGAFGIKMGMILKTLAVISGKALMVSKMALMMIGIIALKKMFSKKDDGETSVIQVHTLHDEHDRNINTAMYNIRHI